MSKHQCPYCNTHVTYWQKLKPSFLARKQFIFCPACGEKISSFWVNAIAGIVGLSAGLFLFVIHLQHPMLSLGIAIFLVITTMLLLPLRIDLIKCDDKDAIRALEKDFYKKL